MSLTNVEDLITVTYADTGTYRYTYDPNFPTNFHKPTVVQDPLGHRTTNSYDQSTGDLLTSTNAVGTTTYSYTNGLLHTVTDPLNHTSTYDYDTTRRLLLDEVDGLGNRTSYGYDAVGN